MNVAWRMVAFPCDEHIATPPVFTHPNGMLPQVGTLHNRTSKASAFGIDIEPRTPRSDEAIFLKETFSDRIVRKIGAR